MVLEETTARLCPFPSLIIRLGLLQGLATVHAEDAPLQLRARATPTQSLDSDVCTL